MPQVELNDRVFAIAQQRASDEGFASVEEFISDLILRDSSGTENLDHLFTPEVIAELDRISAEVDAGGKTYSVSEVREHFESRRKAWLANHAG